jgi:nicotinamide riboside kinase
MDNKFQLRLMKIGICGTMSVGKTTLVQELQKLDQFKEYFSATERSEYLNNLGVPLNDDSSIKGQFIFMAERASELLSEKLITDRTIYDVAAFTMSANSIDWDDKVRLVEAFMILHKEYDIVFYVNPEGTVIEDNGVRTTNPDYRNQIDFTIKEALIEWPPKKMVELRGTTEERIKVILEHIS